MNEEMMCPTVMSIYKRLWCLLKLKACGPHTKKLILRKDTKYLQ